MTHGWYVTRPRGAFRLFAPRQLCRKARARGRVKNVDSPGDMPSSIACVRAGKKSAHPKTSQRRDPRGARRSVEAIDDTLATRRGGGEKKGGRQYTEQDKSESRHVAAKTHTLGKNRALQSNRFRFCKLFLNLYPDTSSRFRSAGHSCYRPRFAVDLTWIACGVTNQSQQCMCPRYWVVVSQINISCILVTAHGPFTASGGLHERITELKHPQWIPPSPIRRHQHDILLLRHVLTF